MGLYRSDRDADRDIETETRQEGAEWNKEAQEMGKGQWPAGCPVRPLLSPICILSPCHSSEGHSMPTGCFLVPRPSDRQEGGIKREQVEKRGWRETGLGRPLPASPATPWTMSSRHPPAGAAEGQAHTGPGVPGHEGDGDPLPAKGQLQLRKPCVWTAGCPLSPVASAGLCLCIPSQLEQISLEEHVVAKKK